MITVQTKNPEDRIPVIVGVGEICDRPAHPSAGLEPLALMAEALKRAEQESGCPWLAEVDSLDVISLISWRYRDPAGELSRRLGMKPRRLAYGPVGGESPVRILHEAALRIARGESHVAAICGAEAQSTVSKAVKAGVKLPWTPFASEAPDPVRHRFYQHPMAVALGVALPVTVYPFYEAASAAHWGQTPREALSESAALWSAYSEVASHNPNSWLKRHFQSEEILTPTPENRLIAWPYTKLMVANPTVNQGAALLVTSLARARDAGIPDGRLVYFTGGAWADEPNDYLERDVYFESHAQNAVLESALELADGNVSSFDAIELYSCFPCVPKMARRTLGLPGNVRPTVTGGLTFFGAPLSTYMAHAACAMVRRLRGGGTLGLLYGQGGYVTKHHALVLASQLPPRPLALDMSVQGRADRRRGSVPKFLVQATGEAFVESFTVLYEPSGEVKHGALILRTRDGGRTLARVPAQDKATLAHLMNLDRSPVGASGFIRLAADGVLEWRIS